MSFKSNATDLKQSLIEYTLPSGGLPYKKAHPKFPDTVEVKSFTFLTEAILTTNLRGEEKMRRIAKEVVANFPDDFDWDSLLDGDQMMILALARAQTYGENWSFSTVCPVMNCNHRESHSLAIPGQLQIKQWKLKLSELDKFLTVTLPVTKDAVRLRPLSVADKRSLVERGANKDAASESQSALVTAPKAWHSLPPEAKQFLYETAMAVEAVNGGTPDNLEEVIDYLLKLPGKDKTALEMHQEATACGIDFTMKVKCDKCGYTYQAFMPLATNFFRRDGQ